MLTRAVQECATGPVRACYLDHHSPLPPEMAPDLGDAVVVPILLTAAYHARVDVPHAVRELGAHGASIRLAGSLSPDTRLLDACEELLATAGEVPEDAAAVVVFVAGSSDSAAVTALRDGVETNPRPGWGPWRLAALDGGEAVEEVVAQLRREGFTRVIAVSFMVAGGVLRDRMACRCEAVGVRMVPGALADTSAFADLVVARARSCETEG